MKKLVSLLLLLCICLTTAMAGIEGEPWFTPQSTVNSEKSIAKYPEFSASGSLDILIPGLKEDFVPQGLAAYTPLNLMFFSGYDCYGNASSLIASDLTTGWTVKDLCFKKPDGSFYTGHFGGVCVTDKNIFIASGKSLYRLPMSVFLNAEASDVATFAEVIKLPVDASYCQISNGILWVGEFKYDDDPDYVSNPAHHATSASGNTLKSWIVGYKLVDYTENELDPACLTAEGAIPDYILSVRDRIQGLTFCNNKIYLSQSYGRKNDSYLYRYDNVLGRDPDMKVQVYGVPRPLWFLDGNAGEASLKCPPMTEGLCTVGDSVYISFESASYPYRKPLDPKKGKSENPVDRLFKLNPNAF